MSVFEKRVTIPAYDVYYVCYSVTSYKNIA